MQVFRRVGMAGSVFMLALATGYVTQNGGAIASRFSPGATPGGVAQIASDPAPEAPQHESAVNTSETAPTTSLSSVSIPVEPAVMALTAPATRLFADRLSGTTQTPVIAPDTPTCDVTLSAIPGDAAMVDLSVVAPCHPNETVIIRQGTLKFTQATDHDGQLRLSLPALSADASLEVELSDGTAATTQADVPAASSYEHVGLQWTGRTDLQLHAFEFGATYGQPGHVHAGAAHSPDRAKLMGAGYMTLLGDPTLEGGMMAEVYSFPSADAHARGVIRITVEAEVTRDNCGRQVSAETLQPVLGDGLDAVDLTLSVPGCDALGEFLVLNNVLRDMKIAAN